MRRHLIRLASAKFTFSFAKLGWVTFAVCNAWQRTQNLRCVSETSGLILTICGPKFMKVSDDIGGPSYFPKTLSNCRCHVSFRRYSTLSLEVVEQPSKCQRFLTPIFQEGSSRLFYRKLLARCTVRRLGNVWLSCVCWSTSAKPGCKVGYRICGGWVKIQVQFEAVCGPKFMSF